MHWHATSDLSNKGQNSTNCFFHKGHQLQCVIFFFFFCFCNNRFGISKAAMLWKALQTQKVPVFLPFGGMQFFLHPAPTHHVLQHNPSDLDKTIDDASSTATAESTNHCCLLCNCWYNSLRKRFHSQHLHYKAKPKYLHFPAKESAPWKRSLLVQGQRTNHWVQTATSASQQNAYISFNLVQIDFRK